MHQPEPPETTTPEPPIEGELNHADREKAFEAMAVRFFHAHRIEPDQLPEEVLTKKIGELRDAYEGLALFEIPSMPKPKGAKRTAPKDAKAKLQKARKAQRKARRRNRG